MKMLVFFTTAPEVYDLPGTTPAGHVGFTADGLAIRAVRTDMGGALAQVRRYLAAGYLAVDGVGLKAAERFGAFLEARAGALIEEGAREPSVNLAGR